jgi:hypothetical protein
MNFAILIKIFAGLGHHWPGGQGGQVSAPFVKGNSVNFPLNLLRFLNRNPLGKSVKYENNLISLPQWK